MDDAIQQRKSDCTCFRVFHEPASGHMPIWFEHATQVFWTNSNGKTNSWNQRRISTKSPWRLSTRRIPHSAPRYGHENFPPKGTASQTQSISPTFDQRRTNEHHVASHASAPTVTFAQVLTIACTLLLRTGDGRPHNGHTANGSLGKQGGRKEGRNAFAFALFYY